ncbi:hypothetical protein JX265_002403 [Neoarthrinium moseri]|uniref:Major facilitator superfamily (MFS) profile domain-containing protein n=1 Tax=Neoarthrinium moseri TaxID=1658444 RepID=A0A9Q0ASZ5_9PEZI|nr:hypothetical protein JX265_002403 [Neoarthrinium moseri]
MAHSTSADFGNVHIVSSPDDDGLAPDLDQPRLLTSGGHSPRFWGIFTSLCILAFICAPNAIIISTALPTITAAIGGASHYIWFSNTFINPLIASTALFILGSGIAGGATSPAMLIGGRTAQGVGAGGLHVLLDIVCCDLVPLRERGKYVGLMNSFAGVSAALGPPVGGAIAQVE